MKIAGKIVKIDPTQQISETLKKRNFVLEYAENSQYPEYISFEMIRERCSILDDYKEDDFVEVSFNLKGRKWVNPAGETRYFNSLQAWRLDEPSEAGASEQNASSFASEGNKKSFSFASDGSTRDSSFASDGSTRDSSFASDGSTRDFSSESDPW